jgi:FkbM family methyltransferase
VGLQQKYWRIRRKLLKVLVPEFVWPKEAVIDGMSFKIRNTPYSYGTKKGLQNGRYEVSERKLLRGRIQKGDVVIEMGGSIGVLTALLAHEAGTEGFVVSIEASQNITAYSKNWLEAKGNVKVITGFAFPVLEINKKITLKNFDEEGGSLGGKLDFDMYEQPANGNEEPVFDIKRIMQENGISPTVIVADVEGSERILTAIKPAYPSSVRMVLIELHEHMYGRGVRDQIIQAITADGFTLTEHLDAVYLFNRG